MQKSKQKPVNEGWVYVLANPRMHTLLKIGCTFLIPDVRASELSSTGVPFRYEVVYRALVKDHVGVESAERQALAECRESKEFFRCEIGVAVAVIRKAAGTGLLYQRPDDDSIDVLPTPYVTPFPIPTDEFEAWVSTLENRYAGFMSSTELFVHWSRHRSGPTAGPRTVKAMVIRLDTNVRSRAARGFAALPACGFPPPAPADSPSPQTALLLTHVTLTQSFQNSVNFFASARYRLAVALLVYRLREKSPVAIPGHGGKAIEIRSRQGVGLP